MNTRGSRVMKMVLVLLCYVFSLVSHVSSLTSCPKCGGIEVPYPLSTSNDCGDSRYRVYCNNGNLEFLSAEGFHYKILRITPGDHKLVISPPSILQNTCYSSDFPMQGFRLDESLPFNISSSNTVMLLNCSESLLRSPLNCSSSSFCRQFEEKAVEANGCKNTLCCHYLKDSRMTSHMIRVRAGGCTAYTCLVDVKPGDSLQSWSYGIELQWEPPKLSSASKQHKHTTD